MKRIRVACICPIPVDPTSFYRGMGPWLALEKAHPELELHFPTSIDWPLLKRMDLVFLQRPAMPDHFAVLVKAKDLKLPVIVDFDDDNLSVPKDNPTYPQYSQMPIKDAIVKLSRHADQLWVTTKFLQKKFGIYNKNIHIIPNAIDDSLLHLRQIPPGPRAKRALWRGTPSHNRNLMSVGKEIISLSRKYGEMTFTFFGLDPIDLTDHIKRHEIHGQVDMIDFLKVMCQMHAQIVYYPLIATDHAQARSHISWLESSFSGSPMLASKNEEFTRPGLLNFSTPQEFEEQMDHILKNEIDLDKCVNDSWAHIQENYMLSRVNDQRWNLIQSLL